MNIAEQKRALNCAIKAARAAGKVMRENLWLPKKINSKTQHDIKLELDVRCQKLIGETLAKDFPEIALLGEEGISGDPNAPTLPKWPTYSATARDTMLFNNECRAEPDPDRGPRLVMEQILKLS